MNSTILTIVGARPQFIKAAVVSRALRKRSQMAEVLVHTGQHYDDNMSKVFFEELGMQAPIVHLGVGSLNHGAQTGRMLEALELQMIERRPQVVLVYGDTNSTLAGALAAAKLKIPIAHVEAGLRSFNRGMPEEINRVVADHVASLLFTPTETADANLRSEGVPERRIKRVGDVMYDALIHETSRGGEGVLVSLGLATGSYVLATVHRAENTDDLTRLHNIFTALDDVAAEIPVIVPLHPRTRAALASARVATSRIRFLEPIGYRAMSALEAGASVIVTDSGGVQKEAYMHGVPCVTVRDETEWVELVDAGWNVLTPPTSSLHISRAVQKARESGRSRARPDLYGDGHAGERIAEALAEAYGDCP